MITTSQMTESYGPVYLLGKLYFPLLHASSPVWGSDEERSAQTLVANREDCGLPRPALLHKQIPVLLLQPTDSSVLSCVSASSCQNECAHCLWAPALPQMLVFTAVLLWHVCSFSVYTTPLPPLEEKFPRLHSSLTPHISRLLLFCFCLYFPSDFLRSVFLAGDF